MDAGADPLLIARVMRHASFETTRRHYAPGNVQRDAKELRRLLVSGESDTSDAESITAN